MNTLVLALAYLRFHWARSLVLVIVAALVVAAPLAVERLATESEARMTARADATPLILGARGSRLDLVMAALYFSDDRPERTSMAAAERVWDSGLAVALPLHLGAQVGGAPVVGTTLDYFDFRGLEVVRGRPFAVLGEAVLGAAAAERLGVGAGGHVISAPGTLFDLGGVYPLRMPVAGVLAETGGPDDAAVFVDLKTAWVIEGIGHGHDDVIAADADTGDVARAAAGLREYREITPETLDGFHFHGPPDSFPVDAVIAVPPDARAATILRGRYLDRDASEQIVAPSDGVGALFARVFRVKRVFDAVVAMVGVAAALAVALAIYLSLQLRRAEMETAFRLGGSRWAVARLAAVESGVLLAFAALLALALARAAEGLAGPAAAMLMAAAA